MAGSSVFPVYIKAEFDGNIKGLATLSGSAADAGNKAGRHYSDAFKNQIGGISNSLGQALSIPRNAGGSLDLSQTISQLRMAATEAGAYSVAAREMALAQASVLSASTRLSSAQIGEIIELNKISRERGKAALDLDLQATAYERLQLQINKTTVARQNILKTQREIDQQSRNSSERNYDNKVFSKPLRPATLEGAGFGALDAREEYDILRRAEVGLAEQETILQSVHRNTALELDRVTKSAKQSAQAFIAAASEEQESLASLAKSASILRNNLDPMYAAQKRFDDELKTADMLLNAGTISTREYAAAQQLARNNLQSANQQIFDSAKSHNQYINSTKGMRQATVQAGQQFQDIAISIGGGQRASTVLAQQLPQLAFAFSNVTGKAGSMAARVGSIATTLSGPWGVAIALGAFALSPLIDGLFKTEKGAEKAKESNYDFSDSLTVMATSAGDATNMLTQLVQQTESLIDKQNDAIANQGQIANLSESQASDQLFRLLKEKSRIDKAVRDEAYSINPLAGMLTRDKLGDIKRSYQLPFEIAGAREDVERARQAKVNVAVAASQRNVNESLDKGEKIARVYQKTYGELTARFTRAEKIRSQNQGVPFDGINQDTYTAKQFERDLTVLKSNFNRDKKAYEDLKNKNSKSKRDPSLSSTYNSIFAKPEEIVDNYKGITSGFGKRTRPTKGASSNHLALDLAAPNGSNIRAANIGTVELVGFDKGLGKYVVIDHGAGTKTRYGHMSDNSVVSVGDRVDKGDVIGKIGSTGTSTGSHLHYEAILNAKFNKEGKLTSGRKVDPRKALPINDSEASADTQRNIEVGLRALQKATKETERLARISDAAAQSITGVNAQFDDQPRLVDQSAAAVRKLEEVMTELSAKGNEGTPRIEELNRDAKLAMESAKNAIQTDFGRDTDKFQDRLNIQELLLAGRKEEAQIAERIQQSEEKYGLGKNIEKMREELDLAQVILATVESTQEERDKAQETVNKLTPEYEKQLALQRQIYDTIVRQSAQENAMQDAIDKRTRSVERYQSVVSGTYKGLEDLLSGGNAGDFFKSIKSQFDQLRGQNLTESLFGDAFAKMRKYTERNNPENIATNRFVSALGKSETAVVGLADVLIAQTNRLTGAANDNSPLSNLKSKSVGPDGTIDIVVSGESANAIKDNGQYNEKKFSQELARSIVAPFLDGLNDTFGTKFFSKLEPTLTGAYAGYQRAGVLGATLGAGSGLFNQLSQNSKNSAQANAKLKGISASLESAGDTAAKGQQAAMMLRSVGVKTSKLGGQIGAIGGKAIGTAIGGPAGGKIGEIAGAIYGSVVGGLFKKTPKGSVSISNTGATATGTKGVFGGLKTLGSGVNDSISSIADRLGGTVGNYSVNIRQKKKKFYVGNEAFTDEAEAGRAAMLSAIQNGAIVGLKQGALNLLRAGKDIEKQVSKAVEFQSVFDRLKQKENPLGFALDALDKEFTKLKTIFGEASASAAEYGSLTKLYELERADVIEQAQQRITGSLKSLYANLTAGNDARSLTERQSFAMQQYSPLAARLASGDTTAYDNFAEVAQQLLDIERQMFGSQASYFTRLNEVTSLTKGRIDAESNVTSIAAGRTPLFGTASPANDNLPVINAIGSQTSDLLAGLQPVLNAINANIATLNLNTNYSGGGGGSPLNMAVNLY